MGVETSSSATGDYVYSKTNALFPSVSAGSAITNNPRDLVLGSLLQVNQQTAPATYRTDWLTNNPNKRPQNDLDCVKPDGHTNGNNLSDMFCPTDDGTDWLPGHGPSSANADAGHQEVESGPEPHFLKRHAQVVGSYLWGGVAIYVKLP